MKKIFIIAIIILLVIFVPSVKQFVIENGETHETVFVGSKEEFKEFYVSFLHSVNRTPVNEFYRISGDNFIVYKTTFYSYGAGMPDGSDNPDIDISFNDGMVEINNINKEMNEFTYMVGTYAAHTVHAKDLSFKLEKLIEPQKPAVFKIKRCSIFNILRRRIS